MMRTDKLLAEKRGAIHKEALRLATVYFLRTGRVPPRIKEIARATAPENFTRKFNPNHDPSNGQFTSGPGGSTENESDDNSDDQNQGSVNDQLSNLLQTLLGISTAHAEEPTGNVFDQPSAGKDPGAVNAVYKDGSVIIDPLTDKPLLMPQGVSMAGNAGIGKQLGDLSSVFSQDPNLATYAMPEKEVGMIALFWPKQSMDYQRIYSTNGFNSTYTDFGNYNYGIVAAAAGYTPEQTLTGSGLYNLLRGRSDISGAMYNSTSGQKLITAGYNDYVSGRIGK